MTERITLELTVTVRSPFLFRGLAGGLVGLDAAQLRDEDDKPVLPGTQLQGVLKESLEDLAAAAPDIIARQEVSRLFGRGSPEFKDAGEYDRPERGCILVGDLMATLAKTDEETTRIEIDDASGSARSGHLQVVELVAPFGTEVGFDGNIVVFWPDGQSGRIVAALNKALKLIPAIGAFKSAGFGEINNQRSGAKVKEIRRLAIGATLAGAQERYGFKLKFDRPFLVNTRRVAENAFIGAEIVPGAALKGALARKLELAGGKQALAEYEAALTALVISHAFPANLEGKPGGEPLPHSMIAASDGSRFGDALCPGGPGLGRGAMIEGRPAWFQSDWKEGWFEAAATVLGRAEYASPAPLPRTHTAIDERGVAAETQLYTGIARSPRDPADTSGARGFLFTIDLCNVPETEKERAQRLVAFLAEGLDGIGRTGATASFERWQAGDAAATAKPVAGHSNLFAVVLRTPAVLTDPLTTLTAAEAYADYWRREVRGARLVDFCARQDLAGGSLAMRRRPWRGTYHPFVVTAAGSAFLLEGDIAQQLDHLIRPGLPLPVFGGGADPLDWRNCPFVPQNGFGEIRADYLSAQTQLTPIEHV